MKEHGILFSGPMVRALMREVSPKTQTRRVVTPSNSTLGIPWPTDGLASAFPQSDGSKLMVPGPDGTLHRLRSRIEVGDRLWVRETFNWAADDELLPRENFKYCPERLGWRARNVVWRADGDPQHPDFGKGVWRPSIHMPRWASRLTLEVIDVQVQRVQAISEEDAVAEGFSADDEITLLSGPFTMNGPAGTARRAFAATWHNLNASRGFGWDVNPWVWVRTFRRLELAEGAA